MGHEAFVNFLMLVRDAVLLDRSPSGTVTWQRADDDWLMVEADVNATGDTWRIGDEPLMEDTHLPGDEPDPMEVARSRAGDIAHRIEADMMATLADADASDQEDLVPELVGSAMHQIDILLAEIYGRSRV
jgi:hypothetical protein